MICTRCGRETGNSSTLCALCQAGAPVTYKEDKRGVSAQSGTTSFTAQPSSSAPSPAETKSFFPAPNKEQPKREQPAQEFEAPAPVRIKAPRVPRDSSGETNVFGVLSMVIAIFCPPLGAILAIMGFIKIPTYGSGLIESIAGLLISAVVIILVIVLPFFDWHVLIPLWK